MIRQSPAEGALQHRQSFLQDGYLVIRELLKPSELSCVSRWLDELALAPEVSGSHWVYREQSQMDANVRLIQRIEKFCDYHADLDDFVRKGLLAAWSADVLGGPVALFKEKINFKLSGGGGFLPHQDQQAGWSQYCPHFITAMLTIDPATLENGCLEIHDGSHQRELLGAEWVPLSPDTLDLRPVPTAPGDVIFLDSYVPHASRANLSDDPRRILYLTYNLASHGDQRLRYYRDKHASFPPDIDRDASKTYSFRV